MRALFNHPALKGAAVLFSTIVGAGVLGLPAALLPSGLILGTLYILGVGFLMLAAHLALAEIFEHTRGRLQLFGAVHKILGKKSALLMLFVFLALHMGALVAYLIGAGESLSAVFGGASVWWTCIFFLVGAGIVYRGSKTIARIDVVMSVVTIFVLTCFGVWGMFHGTHTPLAPARASSFWVPFGVLLFAFHGTASVAEVHVIAGRSHKGLSRAILLGAFLPIILYLLVVWGITRLTGNATTDVATRGLGAVLGAPAHIAGNLFATLLMGTCFVTIGLAIKRLFQWDFGLHERAAWALTMGIPALIFALGARQFVGVIAVVGVSCGTIELLLIALMWWRVKKTI